jgi:ATP-binding cassette subfamily C exporter for protease/lipase
MWALGVAVSMGINGLMIFPSLYMLQIYDRVMVSQNALTLVVFTAMLVVALVLVAVLENWRTGHLVKVGMAMDERLASPVFAANLQAELNHPTNQPQQALTDLNQLRQFVTGQGIFVFFDLPWFPIYVAVMFLLHPFLGWLSIGFAVVQGLLAWLGHRRAVEPAEQAQLAQTEVQQFVQGKLRNAEVLESMGMVGHLKAHWAHRHAKAMHLGGKAQEVVHSVTAVSKFVRYTQQSLSLGAGALLVIDGQLSPGAVIAANVLMTRALAPIDMLVGTWRGYITARDAFLRLGKLLSVHPERDPALRVGGVGHPTGARHAAWTECLAPALDAALAQRE